MLDVAIYSFALFGAICWLAIVVYIVAFIVRHRNDCDNPW